MMTREKLCKRVHEDDTASALYCRAIDLLCGFGQAPGRHLLCGFGQAPGRPNAWIEAEAFMRPHAKQIRAIAFNMTGAAIAMATSRLLAAESISDEECAMLLGHALERFDKRWELGE